MKLASKFTNKEISKIAKALAILESKAIYKQAKIESPVECRDYFRLRLAHKEHEVFCVLYLNSQLEVIECEELFRGTIDAAAVYPREVVKGALMRNAAYVIFAHNHPSGAVDPSQADVRLTDQLREALQLVGIKVQDHLVVSAEGCTSFAEAGLL